MYQVLHSKNVPYFNISEKSRVSMINKIDKSSLTFQFFIKGQTVKF